MELSELDNVNKEYFPTGNLTDQKVGIVIAREMPDSPGIEVSLLKEGVESRDIQPPRVIRAAGLTRERTEYLYKFIRPYVRVPYKDAVAPSPNAEEE